MTRSQFAAAAFLVIVCIGLWVGYRRFVEPYAIEREDNIALSRAVTATFAKTSQLKVGTLAGMVQATAADTRMGGLLTSDQVVRAPYTVDYFVDVSKLSLADYRWDANSRTLTMRVPDVSVAPVNVDESQMVVRRRGLFITRGAFDAMGRTAAKRAAAIAQEKAREPEQMAEARANARAALSKMLAAPLAAIGRSDVSVAVRFPADGRPGYEPWDESATLQSVLRE